MEPNHLLASLLCPQCGLEAEMSVQVRYGPCAGYTFRLGEAVDWTREGALFAERSQTPLAKTLGLCSCPTCERMALEFALREFKSLKPRCKARGGRIPRLKITDDYRLGNYLVFLDIHYDLRQPSVLQEDLVTKPGRYIEKLLETALGYPCDLFSHIHAVVSLDGDVLKAVTLLPVEAQVALRQSPVGLYFGGIFADTVALGDLIERYGAERCVEGMYRVSLKLEMMNLLAAHAEDPDEVQEVPKKLRLLVSSITYAHPSLDSLRQLRRDLGAKGILEQIEKAFPDIPADSSPAEGESAGDPIALLASYLGSRGATVG